MARNLANGKVFPVSETVGRPPANTGSALMAKLSPTASSNPRRLIELSEDGTIWTIPGARTKNGRQHVVYLPPLAREIIDAVSRVEGKAGYLFTTTGRSP